MDSHIHSAVSRLEVVATGRRRRWSGIEKERIVLESMSGPRMISATARRYGIARSQLLAWRRSMAIDKVAPMLDGPVPDFLPLIAVPDGGVGCRNAMSGFGRANTPTGASVAVTPASAAPSAASGRIEIVLRCGRRMIVDAMVDAEAVARLARGLEALA